MSEAESASGLRSKRRWPFAVGAVLLAAAALFAGTLLLLSGRGVPPMPALPDLAGKPAMLVKHLTEAHARAAAKPTDAELVGELGRAFHADAFYAEALAAYDRAVALFAKNWRFRYLRALLLEELGRTDEAADEYAEVATLRPDYRLALFRLGEVRFKQEEYEDARNAYERAAAAIVGGRVEPPPPEGPHSEGIPAIEHARLGLARVALARGDRPTALRILGDLYNRRSDFGAALRLFAQVLEESGRGADAAPVREAAAGTLPYTPPPDPEIDALARESCSSDFLLRIFKLQKREENWQWVDFLARRAVEVNPDDVEAQIALGEALWLTRRFGEAIPVLERLEPRAPEPGAVVVRIVECYMRLNRPADAEAWCRRRLETDPNNALVRGLFGDVLRRQEKFAEAEKEYDASLAAEDDYEFRAMRGACRAALGRLPEAVEDFRAALNGHPDYAVGWRHLVQALLVMKDYAALGEPAARLLVLEPGNARAHYAKARAAYAAGDIDAARDECRLALKLAPDLDEARRFLAEILK